MRNVLRTWRNSATGPLNLGRRRPQSNGTYELAAVPGEPTFVERIAQAAGGAVGGYNGFWLDPGNKVIRIDGVPRSSIVVDPPDGHIPALTDAGKQRMAERAAFTKKFGEFDGPEIRSLSDRCLTSFGSNLGPPMLPNYFYNNNYTIVQTKDHVMILTEMVHDTRVIRLGATRHAPAQVRPWFGDSIGHWEGDTLVVETTNINPTQLAQMSGFGPYRGASDQLKVTERFTRTGPDVLLYKFTVEDPRRHRAVQRRAAVQPHQRDDSRVRVRRGELRASGHAGGGTRAGTSQDGAEEGIAVRSISAIVPVPTRNESQAAAHREPPRIESG